jgi:uncharacterized repeat protein (TIGR03803 family)
MFLSSCHAKLLSYQFASSLLVQESPGTPGPGGALYGMAQEGGYDGCGGHGYEGCGVVFSARPKSTFCGTALCAWTVSATYAFRGITSGDGDNPYMGRVAFDQAGNIYGTTPNDGTYGGGTAFELTHTGGGWTETILHQFGNTGDGSRPLHSVVLDSAGNAYGTTSGGGEYGYGSVFQLVHSGSGWTENVLYNFAGDIGNAPSNGVILDPAGNLYGATMQSRSSGPVIFELSPSGGSWQLSVLYTLPGGDNILGNMVFDSQGNLYGVTEGGGAFGPGMIFKLTPSGGGWNFTDLYDFTGGNDGGNPSGDLTMDASGTLYGTTQNDGVGYSGTVWKLAP